jgi:hypothetical protein
VLASRRRGQWWAAAVGRARTPVRPLPSLLCHPVPTKSPRDIIVTHRERVIFGTDLLRTRAIEMPDLGRRRWSLREYFERHWRFYETSEPGLAHPMPDQGGWTVTGLGLPDDVLARLYLENARAVFRLPAL